MMITRRDLLVVLIAIVGTAGAFALAGQAPVMGSAVFDWNSISAEPTSVGLAEIEFQSKTADPMTGAWPARAKAPAVPTMAIKTTSKSLRVIIISPCQSGFALTVLASPLLSLFGSISRDNSRNFPLLYQQFLSPSIF